MSTAAVNYNVTGDPMTGTTTQVDCLGNSTLVTNLTVDSSYRVELRPASVSRLKDVTGWRDPTSWHHLKYHGNHRASGGFTQLTPCTAPHLGSYSEFSVDSRCVDTGRQAQPPGMPLWCHNKATTQALLKLRNSDVNLGNVFAERKETAELFVHAIETIVHGVKNWKKEFGKFAGSFFQPHRKGGLGVAPRRLKPKRDYAKATEAWLQLQYGWKPLIQDVEGACKALSKAEQNANANKVSVSGKCSNKYVVTGKLSDGIASSNFIWWDLAIDTKQTCTVELWYVLASPLAATFSSLGLTNPLEAFWEVTPFSFVVDWFLPVGDWLSACEGDWGFRFLVGRMTDFTRVKVSGVPRAKNNGNIIYRSNYGPIRGEGIDMYRYLLTTPPQAGFPALKNPFSAQHIANAMSLLVQAFR